MQYGEKEMGKQLPKRGKHKRHLPINNQVYARFCRKRSGGPEPAAVPRKFSGKLPVEHPCHQVEITGKGYPQKTGDLQQGRCPVSATKGKNHPQKVTPQQEQPQKGQAKGLKTEEEKAPGESQAQLEKEKSEPVGAGHTGGSQPDPGRPDAHQGQKQRPQQGKHRGRKGQGRYDGRRRMAHDAAPCDPSRQNPHGFCQQDPEKISGIFLFFHGSSPAGVYVPWPGEYARDGSPSWKRVADWRRRKFTICPNSGAGFPLTGVGLPGRMENRVTGCRMDPLARESGTRTGTVYMWKKETHRRGARDGPCI